MTAGSRVGEHYLLSEQEPNSLGRGSECTVVLTDPLCSRVHVIITHEDGRWHVVDAESRNGTFINDQKIDEAVLDMGHLLRMGSTEFILSTSPERPLITSTAELNITQTVVRNVRLSDHDTRGSNKDSAINTEDLKALHDLSVELLACRDPDEVMRHVLDVMLAHLSASVVGYLLIDEEGTLRPAVALPESSKKPIVLSAHLTRLVCKEQRAVWISDSPADQVRTESLARFADAMCVPLVHREKLLGALHVYIARGGFSTRQFNFAIELAKFAAVALDRSLSEIMLATDFKRLKDTSPGYDNLVGGCEAIIELKQKIARLARTSGSVLVRGESGTGKELIARALHQASNRSDRPLLAVNCAAIPAELMESQLFGHKAGSFTNADRDHIGLFQQADHGTLFLDEIGELPLAGQGKMLRILEGHPFLPVGSTQEVKVDVRVIAATNRDLLQYVRERKFREDLYYRLAVFELIAPPLRERGQDIAMLIDYFLEHYARLHNRLNMKLSDDARRKLLGYSWPGNVRQLRNVIDSAVVLAADEVIQLRDLGIRDSAESDELGSLRIDEWERKLIIEAMKRTEDSIPESAKLLGIGRATLYRKIDEYGLRK